MMFGEEFDPRLRAYRRLSAQRRRWRDRGVWQADLGGAGRAPRAVRDLSAGDDGSTSVAAGPIVEAYDFSAIQRLADVGGGHGRCSPRSCAPSELHGVLFDRAEVVAHVPKQQFTGCEGA